MGVWVSQTRVSQEDQLSIVESEVNDVVQRLAIQGDVAFDWFIFRDLDVQGAPHIDGSITELTA